MLRQLKASSAPVDPECRSTCTVSGCVRAISGYDVGAVVETARRWQRPALTTCPAATVAVDAACLQSSIGRGSVGSSARCDWALAQRCTATAAHVGRTRHVYHVYRPPSNGSEVKGQLRQKGESSDGKTSKTRLKIAKQNVPSHCPRRDALANVRLGRTDDWKPTEKHKIACIIRYYYCYYYYIPSLASGNLDL